MIFLETRSHEPPPRMATLASLACSDSSEAVAVADRISAITLRSVVFEPPGGRTTGRKSYALAVVVR